MNWVPSFAFLAALMNDAIANDPSSGFLGILKSCWLGLGIAPTPVPSPTMLMSDITEATYTGYARQPIVWFPTFLDVLGPQTIQAANMQFRPTDAVVPNTITTAFIASALTGGTLLLTSALNPQVNLSSALFAMQASPLFQLAFNANYGKCLVNA